MILYGEPLFAAVVAKSLAIQLIEPSLDWLPKVPERYRKRRVQLLTLADARGMGHCFYKPVANKCFPAGVYSQGPEIPNHSELPDQTPVLVSELVDWQVEFRAFVRERRCQALSPYLVQGQPCLESGGTIAVSEQHIVEAQAFMDTLLSDEDFVLPPAVVVDVGIIKGSGWAVVEANSAWGSGIYGCRPSAVLDVLERATISVGAETEVDRPWILSQS